MRKAFTLVEVLIAAVLVSVVVVGLFQSSQNNLLLIDFAKKKEATNEIFSLILLNENEEWNRSEKDLYEFIKDKFDIKNDDLKTYLKNQKVLYSQEEANLIDLSEAYAEKLLDIKDENLQNIQELLPKIQVDKLLISSKEHKVYGFVFKSAQWKKPLLL